MLVSVRVSKYIVGLLAVALTACQFHDDTFVDFTDTTNVQGLKFRVISQSETDLSNGLPYNCFLPDGTAVSEYTGDAEVECEQSTKANGPRKTNSVTGAAILQELLKYGNQNKVVEIVGTYPSIDLDWNEVTLSGKVMLPKGRKPKRLRLYFLWPLRPEMPLPCSSERANEGDRGVFSALTRCEKEKQTLLMRK